MDNATELIDALVQIEKEKGIDKETIFSAIETALVTACKKNFGTTMNVKVVVDRDNGKVSVYAQKMVVENVTDDSAEISEDEAKKINLRYKVGDIVDIVVTPKNFGRISAQTAKQVVMQKLREAERELTFKEFRTKERDIVTGIVQRRDKKNVIVTIGKTDAILVPNEQVPTENYVFNQRLKFYVVEVKQTTKGPQINISRTHPELVKRLFEQEVPEVFDGIVEIKAISREAGSRTKIAVYSNNPDIDAVGACVGQNGSRVNFVVTELNGEKIDIITWSPDPKQFVAAALSPSEVLAVATTPDDRSARIVVPDNQLSLAIGKEGQNAKLAARLTGWRIDIKSESQVQGTDFVSEDDYLTDEYYDKYYNDEEEEYDDVYDDEDAGIIADDYEKQYGEYYGTEYVEEEGK